MNTHTLSEFLAWIWIGGGVLLIPFNMLFPSFLASLYFKVDYRTWTNYIKISWFLQIIWNLIIFSTGFSLTGAEKGKIDYSLTRKSETNWIPNEPAIQSWEYHFYSNGVGGKKEISTDSNLATPFQEAIAATGWIPEGKGLSVEGLHASREEIDGGQTGLIGAFNELSYSEARAYIDKYNAAHESTPFGTIFLLIVVAVICPFLWLIPELLIITILMHPILSAIIFGPSILKVLNAMGFFAAIGDAFRSRA
jgi:hypothetical protein